MREGPRFLAAAALVAALAACGVVVPDERKPETAGGAPAKGTLDWSNVSIRLMVERYGPPDEIRDDRVVWTGKGPWARIEVHDEMGFVTKDSDGQANLEETVRYRVPEDKRPALAAFDEGLTVSRDGERLSARSVSEEDNVLALNLADKIVRGELDPRQARVAYRRALRLRDAGKSVPETQALLFETSALKTDE